MSLRILQIIFFGNLVSFLSLDCVDLTSVNIKVLKFMGSQNLLLLEFLRITNHLKFEKHINIFQIKQEYKLVQT